MRGCLCRSAYSCKYFPLSTACKLNYWIAGSKVSYLTKVLCLSAYLFCRHVEVRTNAPQGYVFTIKVSEDMPPGSVGFSLVQVTDWHPFISGAWSVYECATKQNTKKMVRYMYFKFQYSIHVYFVEKGQCHNDYSVPPQNGNVAYTIAIRDSFAHKKFNTRELTDIAYMYLSL